MEGLGELENVGESSALEQNSPPKKRKRTPSRRGSNLVLKRNPSGLFSLSPSDRLLQLLTDYAFDTHSYRRLQQRTLLNLLLCDKCGVATSFAHAPTCNADWTSRCEYCCHCWVSPTQVNEYQEAVNSDDHATADSILESILSQCEPSDSRPGSMISQAADAALLPPTLAPATSSSASSGSGYGGGKGREADGFDEIGDSSAGSGDTEGLGPVALSPYVPWLQAFDAATKAIYWHVVQFPTNADGSTMFAFPDATKDSLNYEAIRFVLVVPIALRDKSSYYFCCCDCCGAAQRLLPFALLAARREFASAEAVVGAIGGHLATFPGTSCIHSQTLQAMLANTGFSPSLAHSFVSKTNEKALDMGHLGGPERGVFPFTTDGHKGHVVRSRGPTDSPLFDCRVCKGRQNAQQRCLHRDCAKELSKQGKDAPKEQKHSYEHNPEDSESDSDDEVEGTASSREDIMRGLIGLPWHLPRSLRLPLGDLEALTSRYPRMKDVEAPNVKYIDPDIQVRVPVLCVSSLIRGKLLMILLHRYRSSFSGLFVLFPAVLLRSRAVPFHLPQQMRALRYPLVE